MRIRCLGAGSTLLVVLFGLLLASSGSVSAGEDSSVGAASAGAYRSLLEKDWFEAGRAWPARVQRVRVRALEFGIDDLEPVARALISSGSDVDEVARKSAATRLAPHLPLAHMALASALWRDGQLRKAFAEALSSVAAMPAHLEAGVWLVGSLLMISGTALAVGALGFILVMGLSVFDHVAHDLGDRISREMPDFARAALVASLLLVPVVLGEGILGFALALFAMAFVYGNRRHRTALLLAAGLTVVGLYPLMWLAGGALRVLDADPVAVAVLAAARGTEGPLDVERLERAEQAGDRLAAQALAVRARRRGDVEQAETRYASLLESDPRNAVLLANLGNLRFQRGDTAKAIEFYERAAAVDASAGLMFDLSQAYARAFRMDEFENALARAQALDETRVAELSSLGDTSFVVDLPLPMDAIRKRMLSAAEGGNLPHALADLLAPGLLGESGLHTAGGFGLAALLAFWCSGLYAQASRCTRCGRRMCVRCGGNVWSSDLCDGCHHLFHRPQATDPNLRMARLRALNDRSQRVARRDILLSLVVPGAAGLLARRPDLSFLGWLLLAGSVVLVAWRHGVVADPLAVGVAGPLAFVSVAVLFFLGYSGVVATALLIRRSL